jgi:thymidylate kinase
VHNGYLELVKKNPERYMVIDANRTIEQVAGDVWQTVKARLEKHYIAPQRS